jgi:hypothetical protein
MTVFGQRYDSIWTQPRRVPMTVFGHSLGAYDRIWTTFIRKGLNLRQTLPSFSR